MVVRSKATGKVYEINLESVIGFIAKPVDSMKYAIVVGIAILLASLVVRG